MKYCTKCGSEIRDDDLFCSKCGAKVTRYEENKIVEEDIYSNNYSDKRHLLRIHPCTNLGLIFVIIGYALLALLITIVVKNYHNAEVATIVALGITISYLFSLVFAIAALGTSIPGFIVSKIRKISSKKPLIVLIVSIILAIILAGLYLYVYIAKALM